MWARVTVLWAKHDLAMIVPMMKVCIAHNCGRTG
jgi:hypothetical protein